MSANILRVLAPFCPGDVGVHLAIVAEPFLNYILVGIKPIESRFSINRIIPWERVIPGDVVFMKRPAGPVVGLFEVESAHYVEIDEATWPFVRALENKIQVGPEFWAWKAKARFATLLYVSRVQTLSSIAIEKTDRRPWVVLRESRAAVTQPGLPFEKGRAA